MDMSTSNLIFMLSGVSLEADNRRFPPATFNITAGYILYHVFKFLVFVEFKLAYFHKNYNIKYVVNSNHSILS